MGSAKEARKALETVPESVRDRLPAALAITAASGRADIAGPPKGRGGVLRIAVRCRVASVTEPEPDGPVRELPLDPAVGILVG